MIDYQNIRKVHLEISTRCNAACPDCPRNFRGVDVIDNYPILDMKLEQAKKIFTVPFLQQLNRILINGNYGDFVTASDGVKIVEYFLESNPGLNIEISTNASARPNIWKRLGELGVTVDFRLDGLKDTHHLYRQNTDWDFVIENAKKFISAGGKATWAMIIFDHNRHQINACRQLSKDLGFTNFWTLDVGRNTMPVFTTDRRLSHTIGDYQGSVDFDELLQRHKSMNSNISVIEQPVNCYAVNNKEIYVSATGDVYPCCWMGFYPETNKRRSGNHQIAAIKHNAIEHSIEKAIEWFNTIEKEKMYICTETCGTK